MTVSPKVECAGGLALAYVGADHLVRVLAGVERFAHDNGIDLGDLSPAYEAVCELKEKVAELGQRLEKTG